MKCPYCSSDNTRVIDSRPADDNYSIRRRRLCDDLQRDLRLMRRWRPFR